MDVALPLDKMSVEDKLRTIDILWEDLSRTAGGVPSPAWHRDVLEAREKRIREGREKSIPGKGAGEGLRPAEHEAH